MWSWNTVTVGEPAVGLLISFIFHNTYLPPPISYIFIYIFYIKRYSPSQISRGGKLKNKILYILISYR